MKIEVLVSNEAGVSNGDFFIDPKQGIPAIGDEFQYQDLNGSSARITVKHRRWDYSIRAAPRPAGFPINQDPVDLVLHLLGS